RAAPVAPAIPSPLEYAYRGRLSLRTDASRLGFYAGGTHDLVAVDHCLLAAPAIDTAIEPTARLIRQLASRVRRVEIVERGTLPGYVIVGEVEGMFAESDGPCIDRWREGEATAAVVLQGKRWRHVWGDERITLIPEDGVTLTARAGVFTQVNP